MGTLGTKVTLEAEEPGPRRSPECTARSAASSRTSGEGQGSYIQAYICMNKQINICIYIYIFICIYVYSYVNMCMYIYICLYILTVCM